MAKLILALILLVVLIHAIHALTFDRIIEYKEVSFYSPRVDPEINGYRIAFISDIHSLPGDELMEAVNRINGERVDLLLLGGDYPSTDAEPYGTMEILSRTAAPDGIYGVDGNHDRYRKLYGAMHKYAVTPLSNNGFRIRDRLYLAGVEDLWNLTPRVSQAIKDAGPDDFVIMVTHNPDVTMRQSTAGVDLILSGHTHGGQITLFGIWAPYFTFNKSVTQYGQRFRSGWYASGDGVPVYVSNGIGHYLLRVFARPQVIIFTLYNGTR